ncbi:DNA-directed RNA polymerase subunit D [Candidatus Bathyarchaeota archaeon]|nr:DNA-directed RNA polymerase subunit D [Candidatus Bathyarchaeota archaeon]
MDINILEKNEESIRLIVEGINTLMANTIRRLILTEVPVMALDDIVMIENSSVLHDEILALRLGLIPLKTDLDAYNLPEKCSCKSELGCHLCRTVLTLDVEANKPLTVYSGNLVSEDPHIVPVSEKIPLVKLAPGQKIRLEAYAKLGKGTVHAKWQPVSSCTYRYVPVVKIDKTKCNECKECIRICPKRVFEETKGKVRVANEIECILCGDCVEACNKNQSAIKLDKKQNSFIFYIESTGALPVERIFYESLKIYEEKILDFISQLEMAINVSEKTS